MKLRKIISILAILTLALALSATALAADGDLVYSMTEDEVDLFISIGNESEGMRAAGSPTFTKDGKGIKLSDRTADWNSMDVKAENFKNDSTDYFIEVTISGTDQEYKLGQTDSPYGQHGDAVKGSSVTLSFTAKGSSFHDGQRGFRVQTNGDANLGSYTITGINIWEGTAKPAAPTAPTNPGTGDNMFIFIALGVLAISSIGAVVLVAKAKKS